MKNALTKANLINMANAEKDPLICGEHFPAINMNFADFAPAADIQHFDSKTMTNDDVEAGFKKWFRNHDYNAKKQIMIDRGFKVLGMFADGLKMYRMDRQNHWNDDYVDQKKNIFALVISDDFDAINHKKVIYVLEYDLSAGPLAAGKVDPAQIKAERKQHDTFQHLVRK